jgi:hypothetical protein
LVNNTKNADNNVQAPKLKTGGKTISGSNKNTDKKLKNKNKKIQKVNSVKKISKLEKVRNTLTKSHPIIQGSIAIKKQNAFHTISEKNLKVGQNETPKEVLKETENTENDTPSRKRKASSSLSPPSHNISPSNIKVPPLLSPITDTCPQMIKFKSMNLNQKGNSSQPKQSKLIVLKKKSKIPIKNQVKNVQQLEIRDSFRSPNMLENLPVCDANEEEFVSPTISKNIINQISKVNQMPISNELQTINMISQQLYSNQRECTNGEIESKSTSAKNTSIQNQENLASQTLASNAALISNNLHFGGK